MRQSGGAVQRQDVVVAIAAAAGAVSKQRGSEYRVITGDHGRGITRPVSRVTRAGRASTVVKVATGNACGGVVLAGS